MAWNVGYENMCVNGAVIEGQWEVDADSAEAAKNLDLIPYLIVGVLNPDNPYPEPQWYTDNEIARMYGTIDAYTGRILEETDEWTEYETVQVDAEELAHVMSRISEGVSLADFA